MGLHLHRELTALIIVLLMLVSFQAPVVWGAETDDAETQATQQSEQQAEPEKAETDKKATDETEATMQESVQETEPVKETEAKKEETRDDSTEAQKPEVTEQSSDVPVSGEKQAGIDIEFSLFGDNQTEWIHQTPISLPENSTVKEALETVIQQIDGKCVFSDTGDLESITIPLNDVAVTLSSGDNGENSDWRYMVNGDYPEINISKFVLRSGDKLTVLFRDDVLQEKGQEEFSSDHEAVEVDGESAFSDNTANTASEVKTMAVSDHSVSNAYGNTKDKLTSIGESAKWSSDSVWMVIGLARAGALTTDQATAYHNSILSELSKTGSATMNDNQSSNNSRAILALTAAGYDPTNVGGYNLLEPLSNMTYVRKQGINGPIWALLAFDSKEYEIPQISGVSGESAANFQTTREKLVSTILDARKNDGGWTFSGTTSDVDMTAMAIQALAPYYNSDPKVKQAVDGALSWLSSAQNSDGSFSTYGNVTSESASQVIVALTSLGIDPTKDERFLKNNKGAVDSLLSFYVNGGGFKHISSNYKYDALASMQGYYALVAYYRSINNKNSLYNMTDAGDGYVINVDYTSDAMEDTKEGNPGNESQTAQDKEKKKEEKKQNVNPLGATKGLTKSAGLIKLKGASKNAKKSIGIIEAVVKRGLSEDASTYSEEDIKAINEAYRMYLDLQPAEKLVVEKDKSWKAFCKLTAALGVVYHIDRDRGIDVLDNNDIVMPWYVRLVVKEQDISNAQTDRIIGLLGEGGQVFSTWDISFVNTLVESEGDEQNEDSQWHPSNILKVNLGLPDALKNNPVIVHITAEGKIELLRNEVIKDEEGRYESFDSYAQFQSDDFSVYGVAGTSGSIRKMISQINEKEPQTDYLMWIYGCAAALAILALILILLRRSRLSKEVS